MDKGFISTKAREIRENIGRVIIGKETVIDLVITATLAGGHILLEDNPGTGKTMMAKTLAKSIDGDFKRIQFTPDLLPSDVTGLNVYNQRESEFKLLKGPVFTNILLADEINRATPRTQSSLLEAMEEKQVTIEGNTISLENPFMVIATENPLETIGTYPLPEAQLDRFIMKLDMGVTNKEDEMSIIDNFMNENPIENISPVCSTEDIAKMRNEVKNIFVHALVREYLVDIILATRSSNKLNSGVSTRGTLAFIRCCQAYAAIKGREYVCPDDAIALAPYVLGHRVIAFGGNSNFKKTASIIRDIVAEVEVPVEKWEI